MSTEKKAKAKAKTEAAESVAPVKVTAANRKPLAPNLKHVVIAGKPKGSK